MLTEPELVEIPRSFDDHDMINTAFVRQYA